MNPNDKNSLSPQRLIFNVRDDIKEIQLQYLITYFQPSIDRNVGRCWRSVDFESKLSSHDFFQKTNEWIHFYYYVTCFRSFFGRNWRLQKDISKLSDL